MIDLMRPRPELHAVGEDAVGAVVGLGEFAAFSTPRQYSLASMMVRMRVVTAGSAESGE
jgi:hypothetical protein